MWEFLQVQFGISFVGYQVYLVYLLALIAYHDKSGPDMGMEFFLMPSREDEIHSLFDSTIGKVKRTALLKSRVGSLIKRV